MKLRKTTVSILAAVAILLNTFVAVYAEGDEIVNNVKLNGSVLTVSGNIGEYGKDVDLFLLKNGKTVVDLNNAVSTEKFSQTVNYCNVLRTDLYGNFSDSFEIKDMEDNKDYLLYVKYKDRSYTRNIAKIKHIYVSKKGNDLTGDGSLAKPFATIQKAKSYLRNIKKTAPVEVIIGGGVYNISESIEFDRQDSGTADYPITYKAAENEQVIFEGVTRLDISGITGITDKKILSRLQPNVADKLVEIDLRKQGIPENTVNFLANHTVSGSGKPIGVYLNDSMQTLARWPNTGYRKILNGTTPGGSVSNQTAEPAVIKIDGLDKERAERWTSQTDMYVEGYMGVDWHIEWARVGSIDADNLTVTLAGNTHYGVECNKRIAVVNLPEEIDIPGEWYADVNNMKMYYYPPHKLTDNDKLEIATLCENFITVNGASNINFEGLQFSKNADSPAYTATNNFGGNGITVTGNSSDIKIRDCILKNIGMDGIVVNGAENVDIDGCIIYNVGFSGIYVNAGERKTLASGNINITNCIITDINRDTGNNSMAGIRVYGVGTVIENNILFDIPNSAIRYAGNNHIIRLNEIYNCVNNTADAGAVYAGRNFTNYGSLIKNNYFHDIGSNIDTSYMASAVFWDDNHSGNSFIGNLVEMNKYVKSSAVEIGGGRDNVVEDNIIVNSQIGIEGSDRTVNPPQVYDSEDKDNFYNGTAFQSFKEAANNVDNAYYITDSDWLEPYMYGYPTIMENFRQLMYEKRYLRANTIKNNVLYNCTLRGVSIGRKMTADSVIENNVVVNENDFVDVSLGDYRIKSNIREKFGLSNEAMDETFNMNKIGLQNGYTINDDVAGFDLVYPANNSSIGVVSTVLQWMKSPFADSYTYEVAADSGFNNIVAEGSTVYNIAEITNLEPECEYYWRVTANNNSKQIGKSYLCNDVFRFTTSGELLFENVSYDKMMNAISLKVTNTKANNEKFSIIVADKDSTGKLIALRSAVIELKPDEVKSLSVSTFFEEDTSGTIVELYAWDSLGSMKNLMDKKQFIK